jgi:hypothetical protein
VTRLAVFWLLAAAWAASFGCQCEDGKARKAFDNFMGFARGDDTSESQWDKQRAYTIRRRHEAFFQGRSRAVATIEVDPGVNHDELKKILRDACHDEGLMRGVSALKVVAWPGKLRLLVSSIGEAVFARDGHGWEGSGVGFETIEVRLPTDEDLEQRELSLLTEDEYLQALGVDNMVRRNKSLEEAIGATARRHGVSSSTIRAAVEKAQRLFGRPRPPDGPTSSLPTD